MAELYRLLMSLADRNRLQILELESRIADDPRLDNELHQHLLKYVRDARNQNRQLVDIAVPRNADTVMRRLEQIWINLQNIEELRGKEKVKSFFRKINTKLQRRENFNVAPEKWQDIVTPEAPSVSTSEEIEIAPIDVEMDGWARRTFDLAFLAADPERPVSRGLNLRGVKPFPPAAKYKPQPEQPMQRASSLISVRNLANPGQSPALPPVAGPSHSEQPLQRGLSLRSVRGFSRAGQSTPPPPAAGPSQPSGSQRRNPSPTPDLRFGYSALEQQDVEDWRFASRYFERLSRQIEGVLEPEEERRGR
ncbi:hypothetical protein RUND412_008498 [Rhizina undulata]